jgi:DNA modification methylase
MSKRTKTSATARRTWRGMADLEPLLVPLDELEQDPENARVHGSESTSGIMASLDAHGQVKPIVTWAPHPPRGRVTPRSRTVIAGNGTLLAARELGFSHLACVRYEGTRAQARAYALADNHTADLSTWDRDRLAGLLQRCAADGVLEATAFSAQELEALVAEAEAKGGKDTPDPEPEERPAKPVSEPGEVFELGPHLLACGDSSDHDVARLIARDLDMVLADPPYGMKLDTDFDGMHNGRGHRGKRFERVIGDDKPFDPRPHLELWQAPERFWWGADYYRATLPGGGSWIVWDKRESEAVNLDAVHGAAFELAWSEKVHKREIARVLWSGHHGMQREDTKRRVHPTQKPTALAEWFLERWCPKGGTVGDPFAGSGYVLIACARTRRKARLVELDPGYCDVIRKRWTKWAREAGVEPGSGALE